MALPSGFGIGVGAHDLAAVVDVEGHGSERSIRVIDRGENASLVPEKAMESSAGIDVVAHDLAAIVDADGEGARRWHRERSIVVKLTVVQKKAMERVLRGLGRVAGILPPRRPELATASAVSTAAATIADDPVTTDAWCGLPKPC